MSESALESKVHKDHRALSARQSDRFLIRSPGVFGTQWGGRNKDMCGPSHACAPLAGMLEIKDGDVPK